MKVDSLIEILSACHLSAFVESIHKERGGIMLIGPPASLKTAVTEVLDLYPANQLLSDLTVKQAVRLRDDISGGKITTLAFTDFAKLYQRQSSGASNIEGFLRAVTAEGFRRANWEDSRIAVIPARCMVVASMTQHFYTKHYADWIDDGFARRFLRCVFRARPYTTNKQHPISQQSGAFGLRFFPHRKFLTAPRAGCMICRITI